MAEWSKALDLSSSGRKSAWVRTPLQALFYLQKVRHPGIEPGASAWEAPMLPLHQWRSRHGQQNVENPGFDPGASSLRTTHSTD